MRALIWTLGVIATLAGLGVGAAFGVAYYVQNRDMADWARWGAAQAGYQAEFGGPVTVQLWPKLVLKVEGLRVPALQGEGELVRVDAAAVQAAWGTGLTPWRGIRLEAIEAKNPTITLLRSASGVANWMPAGSPLSTAEATPAVAKGDGGLGVLTAQGGMLAALRVTVQNLNLTYDDKVAGQSVVIRTMNISARTAGTQATTTLDGKVNGEALVGELVVDVAKMEDIPLQGKLEGAGLLLAVNGRVQEQKIFAGLVNARTGNLKQTLTTLMGKSPAQAPAAQASLTGDVVAGGERVKLRNFAAKVGDLLQASGDVDVVLGATPSGKGDLRVQGSNLRQLVELFAGAEQPTLPARPFLLRGNLIGEGTLTLKDLTFELDTLATLKGTASVTPHAGGLPDLEANLRLSVPSLRPLAMALGQGNAMPAQPLNGTFVVSGKGGVFTLDTVKLALDSLATMDASGRIDATAAKPNMDVTLALKGDNMETTARAFGVAGSVPASAFSASARIAGLGTMKISDAKMDLPGLLQATMDGTVMLGNPANVDGVIQVAMLQADRLGFCSPAVAPAASANAGGKTAAAAGAPWSDEPIDLSVLRKIALNVTVSIQQLTCGSFPAQTLAVGIHNTPSQLDVKDLNVGLRGGGYLKGTLTLAHAGTPKLNTDLKFETLKIEEIVPALQAKGIALPLNGTVNLSSVGSTSRDLVQNLGGVVAFSANQGRLPYTSMLGNVVALERSLQGQAALPANGDGSVDTLNGQFALRQGVATIETLDVSTGNGAMKLTGTGAIDLPNWVINMTLTPRLATSSGLEVPVLIKGALTAPAIAADPAFTSKLIGRLATQGLKGLLGKDDAKGVGGVLGDVLSGKGVTQESVGNLINQFVAPKAPAGAASPTEAAPAAEVSPSAEAPAAVRPQDVLQQALPGLLNGVLGQ
jgi:hypothetical protein